MESKFTHLILGHDDPIISCLASSVIGHNVEGWKNLENYDSSIPLIFRGMTQRKAVALCEKQNRDYYYIDTGYIGNMQKRKDWHRVVKNGMQHSHPNYNLPDDRFNFISRDKDYLRFPGWKKHGTSILVVTPSEKPCLFYNINRNEWVKNTIEEIKKHTDRPIIIRDKTGSRRERVGSGSIYNQMIQDNVFAVVTYNSIAATEAIGFGIPAFTLAPNAADPFCLKDLSKIETPLYSDTASIIKWQHWIGYCQFTTKEMMDGTALRLIEEYNLR
jgi:hypothetical protein